MKTIEYSNQISFEEKSSVYPNQISIVEPDYEEFLTEDDFAKLGEEISQEELEKIDGHPIGEKNEMVEIKESDPEIIGSHNGKPIYHNDDVEEMYGFPKKTEIKKNDDASKIFRTFEQKRDDLKSEGDNRHILLLNKDQYIEKKIENGDKYRAGCLTDYALAVKTEDHNNLELIHSFNEKTDSFFVKYKTNEHSLTPYEDRTSCMDLGTKIKKTDYIDLNKVENIDCLRNLLAKR